MSKKIKNNEKLNNKLNNKIIKKLNKIKEIDSENRLEDLPRRSHTRENNEKEFSKETREDELSEIDIESEKKEPNLKDDFSDFSDEPSKSESKIIKLKKNVPTLSPNVQVDNDDDNKKLVNELNMKIIKRGRGRPRKNVVETKPSDKKEVKEGKKSKEHTEKASSPEDEEKDEYERYELIDKYKRFRASFQFKRTEINPEKLKKEKLRYEIDQLQAELDSKGGLVCAEVFLFSGFTVLEMSSKILPLGLKLDGLAQAAAKNKEEFEPVLKELMFKYNLFSSTCEMRFAALVIRTIITVHVTNKQLENSGTKYKDIDPNKIKDLKDKYQNI
jgi:hypothetical protein